MKIGVSDMIWGGNSTLFLDEILMTNYFYPVGSSYGSGSGYGDGYRYGDGYGYGFDDGYGDSNGDGNGTITTRTKRKS